MHAVVTKRTRQLVVYDGDTAVFRARVVLGKNPGDKRREGDRRTPEGEFYVCYRNPRSKYHRFLGLSYPNFEDAARGLRAGLVTPTQARRIRQAVARQKCPPWNTPLGGEIGLHGPCPNVTWTHGCIAMTRPQIERLDALLSLGDRVTILP